MKETSITIVVLTSCLITALLLTLPASGVLSYDPWKDMNGDGKIDMKDVIQLI